MRRNVSRMATTKKPKRQVGANIQIPTELAEPLSDFAKKTKLNKADIARAGLAYILPKLRDGSFAIVNGELKPQAA